MLCFSCDSLLRTISSRVLRLQECLDQSTEQEAIGINSPKRILRLPHETGSWCTWKDGSFTSRNALTVTRLPIQSHTLHTHHTVAFWLISHLKGRCGEGRGGWGGGRTGANLVQLINRSWHTYRCSLGRNVPVLLKDCLVPSSRARFSSEQNSGLWGLWRRFSNGG